MAANDDAGHGPVSRGGIGPQPLFAVAAVLLGSFLTNVDSRLTTVGLPDLRGAFSLSFDEGAWLSTAGIGSQILIAPAVAVACDRVRPAPRARHSEPGLCRHLADRPVRARLSDADRAQRRARPVARHLRAGDADDRVPQSADPLVAAGDRALFDPRRLCAGYIELAGRLLCRPSRLAMGVLAERRDRAVDGPDGLSGHAERAGQSCAAARGRLGRHAAARRIGLDDLCGPRSGQSAGLARIRHGDGAACRRRGAVRGVPRQRVAGASALGACERAVLAQRRIGADR